MSNVIHWFPGHMAKALKETGAQIKKVDFVVYVLDARAPLSCLNPALNNIVSGKPVLYLLNKADIVPLNALKAWGAYFTANGKASLAVNSVASKAAAGVVSAAERLCAAKLAKYKAKGIRTTLRGLVVGIPNSGKSTFINNLAGAGKTKTGNKPGVTRAQQWISISPYFEVLDTPGTLPPRFDDKSAALHLAMIGAVKEEVIDNESLARELLELLAKLAPLGLFGRLPTLEAVKEDGAAMLNAAAKERGCILKGGEPDTLRAALTVLDDFRKGKMGKICLEMPEDYE